MKLTAKIYSEETIDVELPLFYRKVSETGSTYLGAINEDTVIKFIERKGV